MVAQECCQRLDVRSDLEILLLASGEMDANGGELSRLVVVFDQFNASYQFQIDPVIADLNEHWHEIIPVWICLPDGFATQLLGTA